MANNGIQANCRGRSALPPILLQNSEGGPSHAIIESKRTKTDTGNDGAQGAKGDPGDSGVGGGGDLFEFVGYSDNMVNGGVGYDGLTAECVATFGDDARVACNALNSKPRSTGNWRTVMKISHAARRSPAARFAVHPKAGDAGAGKIRRLSAAGALRLRFERVSLHVDAVRNRLVPPDRCPTRTRSRRNP